MNEGKEEGFASPEKALERLSELTEGEGCFDANLASTATLVAALSQPVNA